MSATPATASEPDGPPPPPQSSRQQVVQLWKAGGPAVRSAAGQALTGSDTTIRDYLLTGQKLAEELDLREAALKLVTEGGPGLSEAARKALDGPADQLAVFMKDGWREPLAEDQRVEAARIVEAGGPGLREAGNAALHGSPDALKQFLTEGQYEKRDEDARVRVAQIEATGGPATRRAAAAALRGSIADVRDFLAYGQHIAAAQDREHATISDLAQQTRDAAAAAAKARLSAEENAEKAKESARLAKEATAQAAAETKAAKDDAVRAADAARRAAESARRAASAAKSAISAARAANAAAQTAAMAAQNASQAAVQASQAASRAWDAAASGKINAKAADDADKAADDAMAIANLAAGMQETLRQSNLALESALAAVTDMNTAADNADASADAARDAGARYGQAQVAADSARRHAAEAHRASQAAKAFSKDASDAASQSAEAARSAATHARSAAAAARKANQHANDAQAAANKAKENAAEAMTAAHKAAAALVQAQGVQDKAREREKEELNARTISAVNEARDAAAAYDVSKTEIGQLQQAMLKLDTDFMQLADQAGQPGADPQHIVEAGRKMALQAMETRGPWVRTGAEAALAGDDEAAITYATSGWKQAAEQDAREIVSSIAQAGPYEDLRSAAQAALAGTPAQIQAFLDSGQYQAAAPDNRIQVARLAEAGGPGVKKAASTALHAPDPRALDEFLVRGQYQARLEDDRVDAARLAEGGSPEVKAAANIALAGPETELRTFVESGRYRAQRRDQLTTAHVAQVEAVIAGAAAVAARAYEDAYTAAEAAATAQGHADEAKGHALAADGYAEAAANHLKDAKASAGNARASADAAAASASTASQAENRAAGSAQAADRSAMSAYASWVEAAGYAASAYKAADEARTSAINAGVSAEQAKLKHIATVQHYIVNEVNNIGLQALRREAEAKARAAAEAAQRRNLIYGGMTAVNFLLTGKLPATTPFGVRLDILHLQLDVLGNIPVVGEFADGVNCGLYAIEGVVQFFQPVGREGAWTDAGLACASAIPFVGWSTNPAKTARYAEKYGPESQQVFDALSTFFRKVPSCPVRKHSFPGGTRVLMADGSTKPIERVSVGDMVKASDPTTGETGPRRVEATIYTPDDRDFTDIELAGATTASTLTSTDHHPYWVQNRKRWVDAVDLRAGDALRTPTGSAVQIGKVSHWKGLQPAYDLTVSGLHTYYVLAGHTPVLVHNTDAPECPVVFSDLGNGEYMSPGGVIYGWSTTKAGEHKIDHVLAHLTPNKDKTKRDHTVFAGADCVPTTRPIALFDLIDEAWTKLDKGEKTKDGGAVVVPMGRIVGTWGEQYLLVAIDPATGNLNSAYPWHKATKVAGDVVPLPKDRKDVPEPCKKNHEDEEDEKE
ncbi:polymorphic toxin-type HINT domain-containing protein [Streptomyces sp. NPDC056756]|uniref:polymorphic toxin-type HINT domain-containing protein n=1 Tax=Streptomyces sp. NPDC056756 TaxID=3345938 RepID=UPI0036AB8A12